tara:strand:+ start:18131 stop:18691 length:561 start_codon:yes stop_codon:yes gene_type:complete
MSKILAFGASSSKNSINKKFASFVANKISAKEVILIDLNDFEMPIYSEDKQADSGIPQRAYDFKKLINECDGIVISFAEHNGSYTAAFKNIYDWVSVIDEVVWGNKPMLLMATNNGKRGGKTVLGAALSRFSLESKFDIPYFSLPNFSENFSDDQGISDISLNKELEMQIKNFKKQIESLFDSRNN